MTAEKVGALLLFSLSCYLALFLSRREKRRVRAGEALYRLVGEMRVQIDCFTTPVDRIFATCRMEELEKLGIAERPRTVGELLEGAKSTLSFEAEEILRSFADLLGEGGRKEQLRCCDACLARLERVCERGRKELSARLKTAFFLPPLFSLILIFLFL